MRKFVGIDPSLSATGLVMINENQEILEQRLIKTYPMSAKVYLCSEQRILDIFNETIFLHGVAHLVTVYIEDVGYMSKDLTARSQFLICRYFMVRYPNQRFMRYFWKLN